MLLCSVLNGVILVLPCSAGNIISAPHPALPAPTADLGFTEGNSVVLNFLRGKKEQKKAQ